MKSKSKKTSTQNNLSRMLLIAGGTASGKTTIANKLAESIHANHKINVNVVELDNYYHEAKHWKGLKETEINWDAPDAINWSMFKKDIAKMLNGEVVKKAKYDFVKNAYSKKEFITYKPTKLIIVEGIFALYDEELNAKTHLKFFVDADSDIRFIRRMKRDAERHPSYDGSTFMKLWLDRIKPMHEKHIQPQIKIANVVLQNNRDDINPFELEDFTFNFN